MRINLVLPAAAFALLAACAPRLATRDLEAVNDILLERGAPGVDAPSGEDWDQLADGVTELLAAPLTLDSAAEIALRNQRELVGQLYELAAARYSQRADAALPNPSVHWERIAEEGGAHTEIHAGIDVMGLMLAPARLVAGSGDVRAAQAATAATALRVQYSAQAALIGAALAQARLDDARLGLELARASEDTARALYEVGNLADFALLEEELALAQAGLAVVEAEEAAFASREQLNVALGLWGESGDWTIEPASVLAPIAARDDEELQQLEAAAIEASLALLQMREHFEAAARRLRVETASSLIPALDVGVSVEGSAGDMGVGPSLGWSIPLLSQGISLRRSVLARLDAARAHYVSTAVATRSGARVAAFGLRTAQARVAAACDGVAPLRNELLHEGVRRYNAMELGAFDLLRLRAEEVGALGACTEARAAHALAELRVGALSAGILLDAELPIGATMPSSRESRGNGGH